MRCKVFSRHVESLKWILMRVAGPGSAAHLQTLVDGDLSKLVFGRSAFFKLNDTKVHVARGGYTGEDGFEVGLLPCLLRLQP